MTVADALSHYQFTPTPGRTKVVGLYDALIAGLRERADLHREHGNLELREMALRFAQRAMLDLEKLCVKWEESDRRGLTY